jgi:hypothetical protein
MKNKNNHRKVKTRNQNAFPFLDIPMSVRLSKSGVIDLTDNSIISQEGHYFKITPKNPHKKK